MTATEMNSVALMTPSSTLWTHHQSSRWTRVANSRPPKNPKWNNWQSTRATETHERTKKCQRKIQKSQSRGSRLTAETKLRFYTWICHDRWLLLAGGVEKEAPWNIILTGFGQLLCNTSTNQSFTACQLSSVLISIVSLLSAIQLSIRSISCGDPEGLSRDGWIFYRRTLYSNFISLLPRIKTTTFQETFFHHFCLRERRISTEAPSNLSAIFYSNYVLPLNPKFTRLTVVLFYFANK